MQNTKSDLPTDWFTDDPDPPPSNSSMQHVTAYINQVQVYSAEMLDCFGHCSFRGNDLWIEFICSFRPASLNAMSRDMAFLWSDFLYSRGVNVHYKENIGLIQGLIDCLFWESVPDACIRHEPVDDWTSFLP